MTDRLSAAVLAGARLPRLAQRGSRALLNGAWLGVLSEERLDALDEHYYSGDAVYVTDAWNERGLFPWEEAVAAQHFPAGGRVAVVAAGGGREVLGLLRAGFDATGWESHPALAAYGAGLLARHGHPDRLHRVPRDTFPPAARAEAAIVGWGALSLIRGASRRAALLRGAARTLPSGAPLLVSFFEVEVLTRELRVTRALAAGLRRARRAPAPEPGDTLAPNFAHVFTRTSLAAEAREAGLQVAELRLLEEAEHPVRYACAVLRA